MTQGAPATGLDQGKTQDINFPELENGQNENKLDHHFEYKNDDNECKNNDANKYGNNNPAHASNNEHEINKIKASTGDELQGADKPQTAKELQEVEELQGAATLGTVEEPKETKIKQQGNQGAPRTQT